MDWERLLTNKRLRQKKDRKPAEDRTSFQIDYDRIIFSSAFRRLQDKTQVFPLSGSDYVRTRLTHSLEVSCVARTLGMHAGIELCKRHKLMTIHPSDLGTIAASAGLAHDIGNPPFGHSGEDAIRHWFGKSDAVREIKKTLSEKELKDIENYEGNAQGFRLLTVLQMPENEGGMKLTYPTLAAFTKYPIESILMKSADYVSRRKFNFFQSEKLLFEEVAEATGLKRSGDGEFCWSRHPLAFLVEAADDICYHIVDFEDAYRLGIVSIDEIKELFSLIIDTPAISAKSEKFKDNRSKVEYLRAKAMHKLINEVKDCFLDNEEAILEGKFENELISIIPAAPHLKIIKGRSVETVYSNSRVLEIEAAGFEVARGILDLFFESAIDVFTHNKNASAQSKKIMQIIPRQFLPGKCSTYYSILLNILDYFSGMTDSYAVSLYKKIKGISLPGW
jgi:dGTPase